MPVSVGDPNRLSIFWTAQFFYFYFISPHSTTFSYLTLYKIQTIQNTFKLLESPIGYCVHVVSVRHPKTYSRVDLLIGDNWRLQAFWVPTPDVDQKYSYLGVSTTIPSLSFSKCCCFVGCLTYFTFSLLYPTQHIPYYFNITWKKRSCQEQDHQTNYQTLSV